MLKIILIAFICGTIVLYLKSVNPEFAFFALIASGILILFLTFNYLTTAIEFIENLIILTGVKSEYLKIILKITVIAYLIEFSSDTLEDFGLKSLSDKLVFIGKILIFILSAPIIYAVFNMIVEMIS